MDNGSEILKAEAVHKDEKDMKITNAMTEPDGCPSSSQFPMQKSCHCIMSLMMRFPARSTTTMGELRGDEEQILLDIHFCI